MFTTYTHRRARSRGLPIFNVPIDGLAQAVVEVQDWFEVQNCVDEVDVGQAISNFADARRLVDRFDLFAEQLVSEFDNAIDGDAPVTR